MKDLRQTARKLYNTALASGVKFPRRWSKPMIVRACSATLMLNNTPDSFDEDSALNYLRAKYGTKESGKDRTKKKRRKTAEEPQPSASSSRKSPRKRSAKDTPHGGGNPETSQDFIPKKYEIVAVEENRPLVEAIREMGALYFRRNEPRKGVSYMNAVKSLRTCPHVITDKESAMALRGVGPSVGKYIEEFIKTGDVQHYEELRSSAPKK
eukprot:gene8989-10611_t